MPKLTLTTRDGTLVDSWDIQDYDLTKKPARDDLINEIARAVDRAREEEIRDDVNRVG